MASSFEYSSDSNINEGINDSEFDADEGIDVEWNDFPEEAAVNGSAIESESEVNASTNGNAETSIYSGPENAHLNSNSAVNTDKLPDNHPARREEESRDYYRDEKPPFAIHMNVERKGLKKRAFVPDSNGWLPNHPREVEVVLRDWDRKSQYWTVDLNGTRYIVKYIYRGPYRPADYVSCEGPPKKYSKRPLVFDAEVQVQYPRGSGVRGTG